MKEEIKRGILLSVVSAIAGGLVTGVFSVGISISEKKNIELKTIKTVSEYFDSVDKDMSYAEAFKTIYQEQKKIEEENEKLNNKLIDLETNVIEKNEITIKNAEVYAEFSDYKNALLLLKNIKDKTSEIEVLINDYSQKYEKQVISQVDCLLIESKYDESIVAVDDALEILPESATLLEKKETIQMSLPQNMIEVVPAYHCGGNAYTEYCSLDSGGTETFSMGGVKYSNGMTFSADCNVFNDISWAIYNLEGKYTSLEFTVCHVDGTYNGDATVLQIFYDGNLSQEIPLKPDMSPQKVSIDLTGVKQLKLQVPASGADVPLYGVGNPLIKNDSIK